MSGVIVVDDDRAMGELIADALAPLGYEVEVFTHAPTALAAVREGRGRLVLADVRMPEMDGIELCSRIHEVRPDVPVIVLTGFGSMETAVQAMRAGAYDFLSKPVSLDELEFTVQRACQMARLTAEVKELRSGTRTGIVGSSPPFVAALDKVRKAARTDVPVLIQGETGTGKELIARELHARSERSRHPFVAVNCSAIPETLVEAELFGHVKGAFTDAGAARQGLFAEAGKGTLFLDEVGELPIHVQPKLLRALQEKLFRPVGANREQAAECRIVAATNVDLKEAASTGCFRSDLYFRLAVIRLSLPPLRERTADILPLAQHFVTAACTRLGLPGMGLSPATARTLLAYAWPGNVRELENAMELAVALTEEVEICPADLPEEIVAPTAAESGGLVSLAELEHAHIQRVLAATGGNKKRAAEILGLDRRTLYRKLDRGQY